MKGPITLFSLGLSLALLSPTIIAQIPCSSFDQCPNPDPSKNAIVGCGCPEGFPSTVCVKRENDAFSFEGGICYVLTETDNTCKGEGGPLDSLTGFQEDCLEGEACISRPPFRQKCVRATAAHILLPSPAPTDLPSKAIELPSGVEGENPPSAEEPTAEPTSGPSEPSPEPTQEPTVSPSSEPAPEPSEEPTVSPSSEPTPEPSQEPTVAPSAEPTGAPTAEPTAAPPTSSPTVEPSPVPTPAPTPQRTLPSGEPDCGLGALPVSVEYGSVGCAPVPICTGGFPHGNCPEGSVCGIVSSGVPGCVLKDRVKRERRSLSQRALKAALLVVKEVAARYREVEDAAY